jgi:hypothetical protein
MAFGKDDKIGIIGVGVAVAATLFALSAFGIIQIKRAEDKKTDNIPPVEVGRDNNSDNGGWAYVETEPSETDMLMRSLLMRPTVNAELNYLYGSAPAVSLGRMTDMIVGTPVPYGM